MGELQNVVIDINVDDDKKSVIDLDTSITDKPSVNFGGGIELLMNEKKKVSSSDIGLGELSDLENELNDLTKDINSVKSIENTRSAIFNSAINSIKGDKPIDNRPYYNANDNNLKTMDDLKNLSDIKKEGETPAVGEATARNAYSDSKSWDGYGKYNNIPASGPSTEPTLTKEELIREKFKYLRKLEELERKGANLTKKYTMESPLAELQGEYEMIISEKEKSNSVKFQGKMLMAMVTGVEFLNNKFDPFDLKMDGLAEQVNENITDYDEIFSELHDKYKSKAKLAPELKLLFQFAGSAIMVHMTNTMFKTSMPGMDDIMKQNPELMQQFSQAAVNSMGESNPGFGNFMNSFMPSGSNENSQSSPPPAPPNMGGPPPSVNTQANKSERYAPPYNRPDLMSSRTQQGISVEEKFSNLNDKSKILSEESSRPETTKRPEMKGPENISNILSGLKTKNLNIPVTDTAKEGSTISIQDLKELSKQKMPKTNRKSKTGSAKNTISLDL